MRSRKWKWPALGIALLGLALARPVLAAEGEITIVIEGGKFAPSEVPVPAGKKIKLLIRNRDATPSEFESTSLHREKVVVPGGEISVFVGPLDPGSYEFFDDFHPGDRGHLVAR